MVGFLFSFFPEESLEVAVSSIYPNLLGNSVGSLLPYLEFRPPFTVSGAGDWTTTYGLRR